MTLLVVSSTPTTQARGGERSLRALLAAAPGGYVVRAGPQCLYAISSAPTRWRSWRFVAWTLEAASTVRSAVRETAAEAVHCNDLPAFVAATLATVGTGVRPSLHVRGWPPARRLWRTALRRARCVVCVSDDVAAHVTSIAPGAAVSVVTNPITDPGLRHRGENSNSLVVVGKLTKTKGQLDLVRSAGTALAEAGFRVVFAGDDSDTALCREIANAAAGAGLTVTFTGYTDFVASLLCDSAALLSASVEEGLPRVVLEACVMEVPVLAVPAAGVRQVLGELVEFSLLPVLDGDVVVERARSVADAQWERARARRSKTLLESWSPERCWERFMQVMELKRDVDGPAS